MGFGAGIGRMILAMEAAGGETQTSSPLDLYVGSMGDKASIEASSLVYRLRAQNISAESDLLGRSVKAQMKYANKQGARFTMILGETELETGKAALKNMESGESRTVEFQNIQEWRNQLS